MATAVGDCGVLKSRLFVLNLALTKTMTDMSSRMTHLGMRLAACTGLGMLCCGVTGCRSAVVQPRHNASAAVQEQVQLPVDSALHRTEGDQIDGRSLIIFYDPAVGREPLEKAVKKYGAKVMYNYVLFNGMAIELPEGKDAVEARQHFAKVKGVTQVDYNRILRLDGQMRVQ